jgi:hypothetical protein
MKINASGEVDIAGGLVVTNGPITVGGSGVIVGTGTANTIPKFTSTNTIGNSSVTDNGTVVTLNGTGETIQATNTASVLNIKSETPTDIPQLVDVYSTTVAAGIAGRRARGTIASPTAVQTDDVLAQLGGRGYGATGFSTTSRARVRAAAQQTWTDSAQGAYLAFDTTPNGGTSTAETFRMNDTYFIPATDNAVNLGSSTNRLASIKSASATISSSSLSSNAPNVFSQTWNNAGGTFTNLDIAITNTANAAASKAISIHTGAGTELLGVNISGTGTFANGVNNVGSAIKSTAGFWAGANAGFTSRTIDISQYNTHLNLSSGTMLLWESTSTITGAPDTGLERGGAGIVRTTTGSSATAATLSTAGLRLGILTKTTNYTTTIADHTILADATSSNLVVTLIASASAYASPNGNEFTVKKIDSTANTVTVQVSGGANIDGAATDVLTTQYQSHNYQADGTKYWIH